MSSRPLPEPPSSEPPSPRFSSVLYGSVDRALRRQCARRYNAGIILRQVRTTSNDESTVRLLVESRGLLQMRVRLRIRPAGGNICDVRCTVDDGASHRFSYSLPDETDSTLSYDPHLGKEIATFLREELEKRLGRLLLQSPAGPPSSRRLLCLENSLLRRAHLKIQPPG